MCLELSVNAYITGAIELAETLDVPVDKIAYTLKVSGRHISVDASFVEGEDNSLLDVLTNEDSPMADSALTQESLAKEVDRALHQLYEREHEIMKMFFGISALMFYYKGLVCLWVKINRSEKNNMSLRLFALLR